MDIAQTIATEITTETILRIALPLSPFLSNSIGTVVYIIQPSVKNVKVKGLTFLKTVYISASRQTKIP
jgi:hypothetical protein